MTTTIPKRRRIIPARAGRTLSALTGLAMGADHPRSRGEHARLPLRGAQRVRIIPARAGSTLPLKPFVRHLWDHPRSRGEHTDSTLAYWLELGSSPLARGAHVLIISEKDPTGIIPARAGSTHCG